MALWFPGSTEAAELDKLGRLKSALDSFAKVIAQLADRKSVAAWCRQYLSAETDGRVLQHMPLRRAVFAAVFHERLLVDSPVETYWHVVVRFGPRNEAATRAYLESAPRSVPAKLGRLLLYMAEFGEQPGVAGGSDSFESALLVLFGAQNIASAVITSEWRQQLSRFRTSQRRALQELAAAFAPGGPAPVLSTLFPQLSPSKAYALARRSGKSVEELTQHILDDPDYISNALDGSDSAASSKPIKFVKLDAAERQRQEDELREYNRQNFAYEYVPLEQDDDPDSETDGPSHIALSEADKKLLALEETLWKHWLSNPGLFDRKSRKTPARRQLCNKLQWSDEQIEGWGRVVGSQGRSGDSVQLPASTQQVETYAPDFQRAAPSSASSASAASAAQSARGGRDHSAGAATPAEDAQGAEADARSDTRRDAPQSLTRGRGNKGERSHADGDRGAQHKAARPSEGSQPARRKPVHKKPSDKAGEQSGEKPKSRYADGVKVRSKKSGKKDFRPKE